MMHDHFPTKGNLVLYILFERRSCFQKTSGMEICVSEEPEMLLIKKATNDKEILFIILNRFSNCQRKHYKKEMKNQ